MSMRPEQENFVQLRRLLTLKRYEQPPPGYFDRFSRDVIERIRAGEQLLEASWFERLGWEAPWLQRVWSVFDTKPVLAGALGVAVCGLLISGIVYSEQVEPPQASFATAVEQPLASRAGSQAANPLFRAQPASQGLSGTGLVVPAGEQNSSLLGEIQRAHAQQVSFSVSGGN